MCSMSCGYDKLKLDFLKDDVVMTKYTRNRVNGLRINMLMRLLAVFNIYMNDSF